MPSPYLFCKGVLLVASRGVMYCIVAPSVKPFAGWATTQGCPQKVPPRRSLEALYAALDNALHRRGGVFPPVGLRQNQCTP